MTNDTVVLDYQEYTVSFVICHFRLNLKFYTHCWAQCMCIGGDVIRRKSFRPSTHEQQTFHFRPRCHCQV